MVLCQSFLISFVLARFFVVKTFVPPPAGSGFHILYGCYLAVMLGLEQVGK
jgi:hypothetical protein